MTQQKNTKSYSTPILKSKVFWVVDQKKHSILNDHIAATFRVIARNQQKQVMTLNLCWFHAWLTLRT
jgi:hypothetical protein